MARIVLAIGLPGAGKSTWFREQGIVPLSSDYLRILLADNEDEQGFQVEVFRALRFLLESRILIGRPVSYVDATNLIAEHRAPFLDLARRLNAAIEAIHFDVPCEVCLARNQARERQVPEDVMQAMAEAIEPPTFEEGFSRIVVVDEDGTVRSDRKAPPPG